MKNRILKNLKTDTWETKRRENGKKINSKEKMRNKQKTQHIIRAKREKKRIQNT